MRGTCHRHRATIGNVTHLDRRDASAVTQERAATLITPVKGTTRRCIEHAHDRQIMLNQPNIDGKGTVVIRFEKFLRTIQRINKKKLLAGGQRMAVGIFF